MISLRKDIEKKPLVSIVICTYNREHYICRAIDSVLNQRINFSIEILVGDDASTDGTKALLLEYQNKYPEIFTLIFQKTNQSTGKNWAQLMKLVNGKYVALCDDDDYWHYENKLQAQVDLLEENEQIGLVHTNYRKKYLKSGRIKEVKIRNSKSKDLIQLLFDGEYEIFTSTVVFRNSLIEKYVNLEDYLLYDFPIQDWVTWMQIAKYTQFYHLKNSTLTYCLSKNSVTRSNNFDKLVERYEKEQVMYKYICNKFPNDLKYDEKRWNKYLNYVYLIFAFNNQDFEKANYYGKNVGKYNFRVICSKNIVFFKLYVLLKNLFSSKLF